MTVNPSNRHQSIAHQAPASTARRAAKVLGGSLALGVASLGAGLAATALPAYADVISGNYTIAGPSAPSGPVTGLTASPATAGQGAPTTFAVSFNLPAGLYGARGDWVNVTASEALGSAPTSLELTGPGCVQSGTTGTAGPGTSTTGGLVIQLASGCNLTPGSRVQVGFRANAPAAAGLLSFTVTSATDATPATSNAVVVGSAGPVTLSAASYAFGANTTYTISNVPVVSVSAVQANADTVVLDAGVTSGSETLLFASAGASGYRVTYTPPGGGPVADPVQGATAQGSRVTLTLADPVMPGGILDITAPGTNPTATATPQSDDITVGPGSGAPQTTNSVTFGTAVSGATLSATDLLSGEPAAYTVSFQASSAVGVGGDIDVSEAAGPTDFGTVSSVAVTDATQGWHYVAAAPTLARGAAVVPVSDPLNAGDTLFVTLANVTNPRAQTISDFAVSTSSDAVVTYAAAYTVGLLGHPRPVPRAGPGSGVVVTPVPDRVGSLATYSISGLHASAAMAGGSAAIRLMGPAGTAFPLAPGNYAVFDSTRPSASGTVRAAVVGGGTNDVTITVPNTIAAGDLLELTVQDVVNPASASSAYSIYLGGPVTGAVALPPFPHANTSYSNGAIVDFAGDDYVLAGGRAFAIANSTDLAKLQKVDHAAVLAAPAGARAPDVEPRPGTLLFTRPVNGRPTIYVAGTDGQLHGFASPKQFSADGYDPALVVTVTSLGGLRVGRSAGSQGSAGDALGTVADGAIVDSSGSYFVFAGGRAFAIPSGAALNAIRRSDRARLVAGTVTAGEKSARIAGGVVLSARGPVYASYQGQLYAFNSMGQLTADGYSGTPAVPVPGTGGVSVVPYSGE
jgi:hypothetical protein